MPLKIVWQEAIKPLLRKYSKKQHPLAYRNLYELLVMVVLSAQDSDKNINQVAPHFFEAFPDMKALSKAEASSLHPYISKVRNFANKANWLSEMAGLIKDNKRIPLTLEELTALKGIGRKSANVVLREAGKPAEGVVVDLHVVRVAPRLGLASGTDPKKIEQQIMTVLPHRQWDAGMAMSFHGREICRPKPLCEICFMKDVCAYYRSLKKPKAVKPVKKK